MNSPSALSELSLPLPPVQSLRTICLEDLPSSVRLIADCLGRPSSSRIRDLVTTIGSTSRIAYEKDALEYNRTFFLRNAVKCYAISKILLANQNAPGSGAVLDVGGGIGTFALSISNNAKNSHQVVVDISPAQVALGRWLAASGHSAHNIRWVVSGELPFAWASDSIALFSYSLCESPNLLRSALGKGWRSALIVDYPAIIEKCAAYAIQMNARFVRANASVALCPRLAKAVGQANVSLNGAWISSD